MELSYTKIFRARIPNSATIVASILSGQVGSPILLPALERCFGTLCIPAWVAHLVVLEAHQPALVYRVSFLYL